MIAAKIVRIFAARKRCHVHLAWLNKNCPCRGHECYWRWGLMRNAKPIPESSTMKATLCSRYRGISVAGALTLSLSLTLSFSAIPFARVGAQAPVKVPAGDKSSGKPWVVPRTPDGKPDLQGNWTNATQTPFERMGNQGLTLTDAQAAALEKRAQDVQEFRDRPSDPNE